MRTLGWQAVPKLAKDGVKTNPTTSTALRERKAGDQPAKGDKTVAHLDLGHVDRGLVNLRGRGEAGLEIAGQRQARKVRKSVDVKGTVALDNFFGNFSSLYG